METVELERKRYQFYSPKFPFEEAGITQKTMHGQGLHTKLCCISQSSSAVGSGPGVAV